MQWAVHQFSAIKDFLKTTNSTHSKPYKHFKYSKPSVDFRNFQDCEPIPIGLHPSQSWKERRSIRLLSSLSIFGFPSSSNKPKNLSILQYSQDSPPPQTIKYLEKRMKSQNSWRCCNSTAVNFLQESRESKASKHSEPTKYSTSSRPSKDSRNRQLLWIRMKSTNPIIPSLPWTEESSMF
jgi:hypothetical protein